MTPEQANTPARRIYLAVQLMYTARDPSVHHETYFILMRDWCRLRRAHGHILLQ